MGENSGYGDNIARARDAKGWSQATLARVVGTSQQQIGRFEAGQDVRASILVRIADALDVSLSYLLGMDDAALPAPARGVDLPLVGRIAAGDPREAIEQSGETVETLASVAYEHPRAFWLRVSGNSMNRVVPDGFYVLVDPSMAVRNGDVGVVLVNGDDATMKRVYVDGKRVTLHPESYDPDYVDRTIDGSSPDAPRVRMVGRVVSCCPPANWHP